ncbi:phosphoglycolate phosphatase [Tepiditoga spiralis]|uniref:Phosphoglycolate phosphatase n=1 Tax=Tepiditoga spiralis TaxID=2108365 RepID=A0A7G1G6H2_9BACT|nr:HAD-IA family hydrolase [Tepiditoga spiralis]BBE30946.1 phosphoglycolate phosphatase [Tepiditoga spiralis]
MKNFIWDFDGTLFNTYPATINAMIKTLEEYGIKEDEKKIYDYTRKTLTYAIESLIKEHNLPREFIEKFWENSNNIPPHKNKPFEDAIKCCKLIKQNKKNNFIITHRDKRTLFNILNYYEATDIFIEIVSEANGFELKPSPESFLYLINKYNLKKEETLGIGDRELDILAGKNSGIKTCFMNHDLLNKTYEADFVINNFNEFIKKFC